MDRIIYVLVTQGGGVDGRDHTDKGGHEVFASFSKQDCLKHKQYPWCKIDARIIDMQEAYNKAIQKLNAVDRCVIVASWKEE